MKNRSEHDLQLEAPRTNAHHKQWRNTPGKPLDLDV